MGSDTELAGPGAVACVDVVALVGQGSRGRGGVFGGGQREGSVILAVDVVVFFFDVRGAVREALGNYRGRARVGLCSVWDGGEWLSHDR